MEKISQDASETVNTYLAGADVPLDLSGNTTDPFTEESSLMGGGGRTIGAPNFITDCFFLVHILISFLTKKAEQFYKKNNDEINQSIGDKDW